MKVDFDAFDGGLMGRSPVATLESHVAGETDRLTDVILCSPHHLAPTPCCAVTRGTLADGFTTDNEEALRQHEILVATPFARPATASSRSTSPSLRFAEEASIASPSHYAGFRPDAEPFTENRSINEPDDRKTLRHPR